MNGKEMIEKITKIVEQFEEENWGWTVGIRFEDKEREVGSLIEENSRHNQDREDEREFPEFGTEEYEELPELDGVSAWIVECDGWRPNRLDDDAAKQFVAKHCYIVASRNTGSTMDYDPDHGEILLVEPTVIAKVF
ncbi:hypothetical protein CHH59_12770 [Shouchella clausii]|uniref:hypothetical protein n=1 Tax=Shouchella clausii TaxID=79880 RepID=UPI000BA5A4F9|nr:hypothetical protein [Shouchella clausii]PAF13716.1 hypothetical protein CHH59_12770 [Shouchella clausii]